MYSPPSARIHLDVAARPVTAPAEFALPPHGAAMSPSLARHLFDSLPWPVWVVDGPDGRLTDSNALGRELIEQRCGVRLLDARLLPAAGGAERAWRCALGEVSSGRSACATAAAQAPAGTCFVFSAIEHGSPTTPIVVALAGPSSRAAELGAVRSAYGLTAAETRLLAHLAAGAPLKRACRLLTISEATARTQLRALFAKTGTHRQAELLMLVQRFPTFSAGSRCTGRVQ